VNALLSFAYALLLRECRVALLKVGLEPMVGCISPALADPRLPST
jgi:CRISPR/Cas system-associated endonuclease Cas1